MHVVFKLGFEVFKPGFKIRMGVSTSQAHNKSLNLGFNFKPWFENFHPQFENFNAGLKFFKLGYEVQTRV